jgi:hypothetical protein
MRTPTATVLAATVLAGALVQAATFEQSPVDLDASVTAENILLEPCSLTQNYEPTILEGGSLACTNGIVTTDNWFGRIYDLDGDHGISGTYCVESLDYALSWVTEPMPTKYQVSCLPQGTAGIFSLPMALLDDGEVFSVVIDEATADGEFRNVVLGGCCTAETEDLAIFAITPDCVELGCGAYFPGVNYLGQTRDWYIAAPDCGLSDLYVSAVLAGWPEALLIQVVHGHADSCDSGDGGDPDVPATTSVGAVLLVLVLLGGGAYFLRRRAVT